MTVRRELEKQVAWFELNALNAGGLLTDAVQGARIGAPSAIHDINGAELFVRFPLRRGRTVIGTADIGVSPVFGAHRLLAVSEGMAWDEDEILAAAAKAFRKRYAAARLVAYSYPKLAVQFLDADERELAMLELWTWAPVPPARERREYEPPADFDRWSLIDETPPPELRKRRAAFNRQVKKLERLVEVVPVDFSKIDRELFEHNVSDPGITLIRLRFGETRELHHTTADGDHHPCFELRGQQTNVWCVAASVQMVLNFYRYEYSQVRLAQELGLGTLNNPNGLPYANDGDVVTVLEDLSSGALDASMNSSPNFAQFVTEIEANRPLISFIPGHSRAVAGFTDNGLVFAPFEGLLVYDPWPPNAGVVTRWENFNASSYRRTFTARVTLA